MNVGLTDLLAGAQDHFLCLVEYVPLYASEASFSDVVRQVEEIQRGLLPVERHGTALGLSYASRIMGSEAPASILAAISQIGDNTDRESIRHAAQLVSTVITITRVGDVVTARSMLEDLDGQLRQRHGPLYGLVRRWLALTCAMTGEHLRAECCYQDALAVFRAHAMDLSYAAALNDYAVLRRQFGHHLQARDLLQEAVRRFDLLGLSQNKLLATVNLGIVAEHLGDWDTAARFYERAGCRPAETAPQHGSCSPVANARQTNWEHLQILRRHFEDAEKGLCAIIQAGERTHTVSLRARTIAHEFMGELCVETGRFNEAQDHLNSAERLADGVFSGGDVASELGRRRAELLVRTGRFDEGREIAIANIRLCKRICDRHELGATERVLGETYAAIGSVRKAEAAFRAATSLLGITLDCYELMRTLYAQGKFFGAQKRREEAEVALLEARQLAKKLELDYYLALIAIALMDTLGPQERFDEANAWLNEATALRDNLEGIDRERVEKELKRAAEELQVAMTRASVRSAETLKTICRVYEDARFPFEDLKPDLAYQVAQSVGGESLFIIARFGGGYRVPLTYNIAINEAKDVIRQMDRGTRKAPLLGVDGEPRVLRTTDNKTLVAVPCQHEESARRDPASYVLCTRFEDIVTITPRQLELLCASGDALARLIEVEEERRGAPVGENDEDAIRIRHPRGSFKDILTIDADMIKVIRMAERAAGSVAPILLEGETGVGKELFARAIHASSKRSEYPFVAINAGGLSVHLIESELFGHVKGAFTGANSDRIGFVESARGGTLFLDEIGEMSEELQVKVLRLLENGEYRRLGESAVRQADVRVISATNRDLKKEVERAAFRRDLYYRVSPIRLVIPPLRMRSRDIQLLVRHFLRDCAALNGIADRYIEIDVKAMEALELYDWPGNVRELYNEILRVVSLIGRGDIVKFAMLSDSIKDYLKSKNRGDGLLDRSVEQYERRLILSALDRNDWNRMRTADSVGVPRTTLLAKLKRLNVASKDHPASS